MPHNPFGFVRKRPTVAYFVAYFDESGKFHEHDIVSLSGFVADTYAWDEFGTKWDSVLAACGIPALHAVKALRFARPLSEKCPAIGIEKRTKQLGHFIREIKTTIHYGVACAIDAKAYWETLTEDQRRKLGSPEFIAFRHILGTLADYAQRNDTISLMFDDEERYSVECYKLFTRIRKEDSAIKRKFISIGFGDDRRFPQLQAADLFAGLLRHDANRRFLGSEFPLAQVFHNLMHQDYGRLRIDGCFYDAEHLQQLGHAATKRR